MQSESIKTLSFLGKPQQCVLPLYQRKYSWKAGKHCKELFENLNYIGDSDTRNSWYLGAIVCQNQGGYLSRPEYVLIDGQQRLTTVTLIICAITEYLRKHPKTKLDGVKNWDSLLKECVIYTEGEGDKWYRLLLNNEDKEDLTGLVYLISEGEDIPKHHGTSNIYSNFQWFKRKINKNNIKRVYAGLRKLEMIHISLDEHDVAQNIFETLNATGCSLTKVDQIRNYLLMGLNPSESKELYNHYWRPMETSFEEYTVNGTNHFDYFVRYYLMMKLKRIVVTETVYDKFREVSENFENAKFCVKELNEFSNYYLELFGTKTGDSVFKKQFQDFNLLKMRVFAPFLMKVCKKYTEGILSEDETRKIFDLCINYHLRKSLCSWNASSTKDVALTLIKIIDNNGGYDEVVEYIINSKGKDRFISDTMLRELMPTDFQRYSNTHFILATLINEINTAPIDTSDLDIICIYDNVDEEYNHKLGNLTLEGVNLCMDIEADSNEEFIDKRTEKLIEMILKVWEYPSL